jgi:hypothetical protein
MHLSYGRPPAQLCLESRRHQWGPHRYLKGYGAPSQRGAEPQDSHVDIDDVVKDFVTDKTLTIAHEANDIVLGLSCTLPTEIVYAIFDYVTDDEYREIVVLEHIVPPRVRSKWLAMHGSLGYAGSLVFPGTVVPRELTNLRVPVARYTAEWEKRWWPSRHNGGGYGDYYAGNGESVPPVPDDRWLFWTTPVRIFDPPYEEVEDQQYH